MFTNLSNARIKTEQSQRLYAEYDIEDALKQSYDEMRAHFSGEKLLKPYTEYENKWQRWADELE